MKRLCLGCLEDWTRSLDDDMCPACKLEHEIRWSTVHEDWDGPLDEADWWGPTENDVNPEDISDGFYVATLDGEEQVLRLASQEVI